MISFIEIRGTSLKKLNEGKFMNKMKGGHLKSFVSHGTDKWAEREGARDLETERERSKAKDS